MLARATSPVYSPSGHLLFTRDGVVLATAFDTTTTSVSGTPTPVFPAGHLAAGFSGTTALRVANNGTLVFVAADALERRLVSVARDGAALTLDMPPANLLVPRLSPDRRRVLLTSNGLAVQAWNLERKSLEQLTSSSTGTTFAVWNRDGTQVIIIVLIPLALRGVSYTPLGAAAVLRRNLLVYGLGGVIVPFVGIKAIDVVLVALRLA